MPHEWETPRSRRSLLRTAAGSRLALLSPGSMSQQRRTIPPSCRSMAQVSTPYHGPSALPWRISLGCAVSRYSAPKVSKRARTPSGSLTERRVPWWSMPTTANGLGGRRVPVAADRPRFLSWHPTPWTRNRANRTQKKAGCEAPATRLAGGAPIPHQWHQWQRPLQPAALP